MVSSSLYNQLNQNQPKINNNQNIQNIINMLRHSNNPTALLYSIAQENPQVASIMRELQANNWDARSLFYKKAQEQGLDPNIILSQIK